MSDDNIKLLVEKAKKYLKTAELVLNHGDYDTAVSRIYYSMFYLVKALLLTKNITPKTHSGTINAFSQNFIKNKILLKETGKQFKNAFDKRLQGDYDFTNLLNKEETEGFLKIGKDFISSLLDYLKNNNFI